MPTKLLVGEPLDDDGPGGDGGSREVEHAERWPLTHQGSVQGQAPGDDAAQISDIIAP